MIKHLKRLNLLKVDGVASYFCKMLGVGYRVKGRTLDLNLDSHTKSSDSAFKLLFLHNISGPCLQQAKPEDRLKNSVLYTRLELI